MEPTRPTADRIKELLLSEINRERSGGFPQLRQVPSTHALAALQYFERLDGESADAFCVGLAESAFHALYPHGDALPAYKRNAAYRNYVDSIGSTIRLDYRGMRRFLAAERRGGPPLSFETRECAEAIVPITAAELRNRVKLELANVIRPLKVEKAHRRWVYAGDCDGVDIAFTVDYSCSHYQLEYWVTTGNARPGFWGSSLERLMGLNFAQWDNIDHRNAGTAVPLLANHIRYCVGVLRRLPTSH